MADEAGSTENSTEAEGGDRPLAGAALKSALDKERKQREQLEKDIKAMQKRLDEADEAREKAKREAEDQSKSAIERLTDEVAQLRAERDNERKAREAAETDQARVERVRRHASEFADADDVVALLRGRGELDAIEDDDTAERVLAGLKRDKPHLLKKEPAPTGLEQILRDGEVQPPAQQGADQEHKPTDYIPAEQLVAMTPEQLKQLQRDNPALHRRSIEHFASGQETWRSTPVHR